MLKRTKMGRLLERVISTSTRLGVQDLMLYQKMKFQLHAYISELTSPVRVNVSTASLSERNPIIDLHPIYSGAPSNLPHALARHGIKSWYL
jgi:hypothetical protein